MKVFELIGLPASGKTTILKEYSSEKILTVSTDDYYALQHTYSKIKLCFRMLFYSVVNIGMFFLLFRYFPVHKLKNTVSLIFYCCNFENYLNKNKSSAYMFDQGVIQYLWSIYWDESCLHDEEKKLKGFSKIARYFKKRYSIYPIFVETDYKVAAQRAYTRKSDCYIDHLELKNILNIYSVLQAESLEIKDCFEDYIEYSNMDSLKVDVKKLMEL